MEMIPRIAAIVVAAGLIQTPAAPGAEDTLRLWPDDSPELTGVKPEHRPTLRLCHGPRIAGKKPAVLICPAGGYKHHSDQGRQVRWLNGLGIAAYVVAYRLPVHGYKHPAPLRDAQRAMRIIRLNAGSWGLDPTRIGVMGGSSGGHVASTLATHHDPGDTSSMDPVDRQGCRPDFVILADAVITMQGKYCHFPSRARLLPENPSQELADDLSSERRVTPETPPAFLVAGGQDALVPAENSLMFFAALRERGIAFSELHFFSHGGHGYQTPEEWYGLAEGWLRRLGVLAAKEGEAPWPGAMDEGAWGHGTGKK